MAPEAAAGPVIALDIGNVCMTISEDRAARTLGFASIAEVQRRAPALLLAAWQLNTGRLSQEEFTRLAISVVPRPLTPAEVETALCQVIVAEMPGMADLMTELVAAHCRPVFFSDIAVCQYRYVREHLSFAGLMAGAILSYEVGALKPAAAMYEALERQYCDGRPPVFYADDKPENVAAAQARGWPAQVFTSAADLRAALAASPALPALR